MTACTTNAVTGCVSCPAIPAIPAVPASYTTASILGWNAGANSVSELDGDIHTVFQIPAREIGCFIGFKANRSTPFVPQAVQHGFYFTNISGIDFVAVVEHGATVYPAVSRTSTDMFEIRRRSGVVSYIQNSTVLYISTLPSIGTRLVNACLYGSGDVVE